MKAMICLILDRSGSMNGRVNDVIGGVNTFIDEQKKLPDPASVAMVRFDDGAIERFRPLTALAEVTPLDRADFQPRGNTPLLDAIGKTLVALDDDWKTEQPDRAILVVVTDGQENASREYTKAQIKEMIESRQVSGKWSIVYLGANVDAFTEAGAMGFSTQNTAGFMNTTKGIRAAYAAATQSVMDTRVTGATLSANLGRNIGEDDDQTQQNPVPPLMKPTVKQWNTPRASGPWMPPAA